MPTPNEVAAAVDAHAYLPDNPGLNSFTGAWSALTDFTNTWSYNQRDRLENIASVMSDLTR